VILSADFISFRIACKTPALSFLPLFIRGVTSWQAYARSIFKQ